MGTMDAAMAASAGIDEYAGLTIDPRTGRPCGDYGTANDAIEFVLETNTDSETWGFLNSWSQGNLDEWPEFYEWLKAKGR